MTNTIPVITFKDALICNAENPVIFKMNMEVYPGDFVYVIGKVGSGKTSLIRTMIAENGLKEGEGSVCGFDLRTIREKEIPMLRRKMGVVFQDFQLLMERSVWDNMEFVLRSTGWKDKAEINRRIEKVLDGVGMGTKAHKMPFQLSGGEQQRVAIARALLNDPQIIIADEPTGNLDAVTSDEIMNLIRGINQKHGTAVVMVTHNNQIVEQYPGRVFLCADKSCREQLSEEEQRNDN